MVQSLTTATTAAQYARAAMTEHANRLAHASQGLNRFQTAFRSSKVDDRISDQLKSQVSHLNDDARSTNDSIGMTQTAQNGLGEVSALLSERKSLALQQQDTNLTDEDRAKLATQMDANGAAISDIAQRTTFNGQKLLDGSFQGSRSTVNGADTSIGALGNVGAFGKLNTVEDIDKVMAQVGDMRNSLENSLARIEQAVGPNVSADFTSSGTITTAITDSQSASDLLKQIEEKFKSAQVSFADLANTFHSHVARLLAS